MPACASCGGDLPQGARFCAFCGTAVSPSTAVTEERRTVTILFVDLVGFTERSDRADPEDVRRTLVPFHRRVKDELERFGGTLDKFIGDAVMGVFGAPVAHDDDPLRAVRAALAIVRSLDELRRIDPDIALRVAVNTGEAVVSFGRGPQVGEAVAGDVVNTASRMQSLAPRDTVVIGPLTLAAVRDRFAVEALAPAAVKGKAEALSVWRVIEEIADRDVGRPPFVGRDAELASLLARFDDVVASSSSSLVTIEADAGVGKSRLVDELAARVGDRAARIEGACVPYGEGVSLAPVEQTIRALTGIDPAASPEASMARLETHVRALGLDDPAWLVRALGAVLAPSAGGPSVVPEEIAEAWARLLAAAAPLLVEIEDLHHASPAFLEVLGATLELLADRPVLVVATTRPRDEPGPLTDRASVLRLGALGDNEARSLLASVLADDAIREDARSKVLERAAGNPLFAIEFARMLVEGGGDAAPVSVQGVVAARLDAVPAEERALALDAAVLGEEIWPEALVSLASRSAVEVSAGLADLTRRGLLEPRPSSFPGLEAYGFAHSVIREVAYGRLPRVARARRHLASGRWLETASGDRAEEWAESLARHYGAAAELAAASGETEIASEAVGSAVAWLTAAGERATAADASSAFATFERVLALAPPDTREREVALLLGGLAARRSGALDAEEILARYEEGLAIARARGDLEAVGGALVRVGTQLAVTGEGEGARAALAEAVETLERLPAGRTLARAYAYRAEEELFAGDTADARDLADRALALLEDRLDEVAIIALHIRGDARCSMGDLESGMADLDDALRRSEEAGRVNDVVTSRNYLAEWRWATQGPAAGLAEFEAALELAERRNVRSQAMYSKGAALWLLYETGEWDRALAWSEDLLALGEGRVDPAVEVVAQVVRTHVLLHRGRRSDVSSADELLDRADRSQEIAAQAPALVAAASIAVADGDRERAVAWLERFEELTASAASEYRAVELVRAVRTAVAAGRFDLAERLVVSSEPEVMRDRLRFDVARAVLAEASGEPEAAVAYAEVAERLRAYGDPFEEAMALLGRARLTGDDAAADRARGLLERLGIPAEHA